MKRTIIKIDDALCNGCGSCIEGCHEGALQLIDGKAIMVSELYCDGLGACIGECPVGAITLEEREAEPYDERAVMERLVRRGETVVKAHLKHLSDHGEKELYRQGMDYLREHGITMDMAEPEAEKPLPCGCPGSMMRDFRDMRPATPATTGAGAGVPTTGARMTTAAGSDGIRNAASFAQPSELRQFPVQLKLLNPEAGFFHGADVLLAADCTAFAAGDFHSRFLRGKMVAVACPKLDQGLESYVEKLAAMIDVAQINTLTVLIMEVPCCGGLVKIAQDARQKATRRIPLKIIVLSVRGDVLSEDWV